MSSNWKESRERSIALKDDDPDTFEVYLHWLYFATVPTRDDDETDQTSDAEYLQLANAYVLGDKLRDGNFKDVIIDAMLHKSRSKFSDGTPSGTHFFPGEHAVRRIYDNTPKSSEARHLLVYFYAENGDGQWLNDGAQEVLPKDFLIDLAVALLERQNKRTPATATAESNTCKYHQHGSGPCYKDRFNHDPVLATAKRLDSISAP